MAIRTYHPKQAVFVVVEMDSQVTPVIFEFVVVFFHKADLSLDARLMLDGNRLRTITLALPFESLC